MTDTYLEGVERDPNYSARIQRRGIGELQHPAACMHCGNGTHPSGYIDLDVEMEWEGRAYLCMTCVEEVGMAAGLLGFQESVLLFDKATRMEKELTEAVEELAHANERLNAYDSIIGAGLSALRDSLPSDLANENDDESEPISLDAVNEKIDRIGEAESESPESITVEVSGRSVRPTASNRSK